MRLTTDPTDPKLRQTGPDGQQAAYLVLSEAERAKGFVAPVRRAYIHLKCRCVTNMGLPLAETYARDPKFYSHSQQHFPVAEFRWDVDGTVLGEMSAEPPPNTPAVQDGCVQYVSQWQERLGWKLFPSDHLDAPEMPGATDVLYCTTLFKISWLEWFRLLFSRNLKVITKVATENRIGKTSAASIAFVAPPKCLQRREPKAK